MATPAVLYQAGIHGARPAVGSGCVLFSCTTHGLVYRDDGTSWTTFLTLPSGSIAGTPALTFGTAAAAGVAATYVATDATLPIFDATVPSTQAFGDAAAAGVAGVAARRDHKHAMPGARELSYVQFTSAIAVTNSVEASADTIVTAAAIAFDGSTPIIIEFGAPDVTGAAAAGALMIFRLFDGSSSIGAPYILRSETAAGPRLGVRFTVPKFTPAAATKTYSIRATTTSTTGAPQVGAGAGGAGAFMPGFIRITRAE